MPQTDASSDSMYEGDGAPAPEDKGPSPDAEDQDPKTTLVPIDLLGGAKEGDTVTVKVVAIHGDEAEIAAASDDEAQEKEQGSVESDIDEADTKSRAPMMMTRMNE